MNIIMGDDNLQIRRRVISLISENADVNFFEASNGEQILDCLEREKIDLLIMDVNMPGLNWLETLKIINNKKSDLSVIVFSLLPSEQYEKFALRSGALAYIEKTNEEDLLKLVDGILGLNKSIEKEKLLSYEQLQ
jgi:DNA-binding NarL/FixJ family response regulator